MLPSLILNCALVLMSLVFNIDFNAVPDLPEFDLQRWWGDGEKPLQEDESIRSFRIEFNDTVINDLKNQIKNRRPFTPPMEGIQSEYGINTNYLDKVLNYWRNGYDFKERVARLNAYPHFKTTIQGLEIHGIRERPTVDTHRILPLLLIHGWPSSSAEFASLIPKLTTPNERYDFVFEVIAVDLPGYGFSQGTNKPGLNPVQIAIIMKNLMNRLGFKKFYIQAGDWGSQVASHLTTLFQDDVLGLHINMPVSSRPVSLAKQLVVSLLPDLFLDEEIKPRLSFSRLLRVYIREMGYYHLQATKPDTIGAALTGCPAGFAAYVLEKIASSTNTSQLDTPHGGLENVDLNDALDMVTIMWLNDKVTTSMRLYAEAYSWEEVRVVKNIPTKVPTAAINFLYEVVYQPDWILKDKYPNLVHSTTINFGGHFAAIQTPDTLLEDIFASVQEFLKFHAAKEYK